MAAPPSTPPAQRTLPASRSSSPSPSPAANADAQSPQKRSFRQRMGTAVRRSSSFLVSRPTTPAPSDDPLVVSSSPNPSPSLPSRTATGTGTTKERGRSSSPVRAAAGTGTGAASTVKRILGRKTSVDRLGSGSRSASTPPATQNLSSEASAVTQTPTKNGKQGSVHSVERQAMSPAAAGVPAYMADTASTAARRASKDDPEKEKEGNKATTPTPSTPTRERTSSESGRRRKMSLSSLSLRSVRTKSSGQDKSAQVVPPAVTTTTATATKAEQGNDSAPPTGETLPAVPENVQTADVQPADAAETPTTLNVLAAVDNAPEPQEQTQTQPQVNGDAEPERKMTIPISDSPRSLSTAPSHDNLRHEHQLALAQMNGYAGNGYGHAEDTPKPRSGDAPPSQLDPDTSAPHDHVLAPSDAVSGLEDTRTAAPAVAPAAHPLHPRILAVRTSLDELHDATDLSPILEDARSAEEERAYNNQALLAAATAASTQPAKSSALATVSPIIASEMSVSGSNGSDGMTPRPSTEVKAREVEEAEVPVREQRLEEAEGYFAPVPKMPLALPLPVPAVAVTETNERRSIDDDPFKDPEPASAISVRYVGFPPGPGSSQPSLISVPPAIPAPGIVSQPIPETVCSMPIPMTGTGIGAGAPGLEGEESMEAPVGAYPLPALDEVTQRRTMPMSMPEAYTLTARSSREASMQETDENAPLLPRGKGLRDEVEIDFFGNRAARTYGSHRLSPSQSMLNGWVAHTLPDASTYYTHPELRLTSDMDLSDTKVREALGRYIEETMGTGGRHASEASVPEGWEVWVHDEALVKGRVLNSQSQLQQHQHQQQQKKRQAESKNKGREAEGEVKKDAKGKAPRGGWREVGPGPHGEAATTKDVVRMNPVRCWVNHGARAMGYWPPPAFGMNGSAISLPVANVVAAATTNANVGTDDVLDHAYRYWAFMEAHPAHVPLPKKAYADARDALTWSYTERLLKTQRRVPPPFTQQEAHELLTVLRSTRSDTLHDFGNVEAEAQVPNAVQTRVVSRILRRVVQWKQHFFRPEKPLPNGTSSHLHPLSAHNSTNHVHFGSQPQPTSNILPGSGFGKTALDVVLAWLCLGIPYLYANRHLYASLGRFDEETGGVLVRSVGPTLIVGIGVLILAGLVLLAALTLLAIPGIDPAARTAALLAALGALASILAAGVAAGRGGVEAQRAVVHALTFGGTTSGEGRFVVHSHSQSQSHPFLHLGGGGTGTVVLSLPAVFLAYATLALLAGLVLYVFRGSVLRVPTPGSTGGSAGDAESWTRVASGTRWTTVGVLGFCGGVLATSMVAIRR